MFEVEKAFPPCTPVRFKYSNKLLDGISLGETFLFKGQVYLGIRRELVDHWLPPDELEKLNDREEETIPF